MRRIWLKLIPAFSRMASRAVFFSSGGFSNMLPRPPCQEYAVSSYPKKIGDNNAGFFNRNRRGFSEIAAQAQNSELLTRGLTTDTEAPLALLQHSMPLLHF
jgi:hypothetical protein